MAAAAVVRFYAGGYMAVQDIKEFYKRIRREQTEIQQLKNLIHEKELTLLPRAIVYDHDKVQVSPEDRFSEACAALCELENELSKSIFLLSKNQILAESYIRELEDANERKVMRYYYLTLIDGELPTWQQVAIRMNYYERHIMRLHGEALQHIAKKHPEIKENHKKRERKG